MESHGSGTDGPSGATVPLPFEGIRTNPGESLGRSPALCPAPVDRGAAWCGARPTDAMKKLLLLPAAPALLLATWLLLDAGSPEAASQDARTARDSAPESASDTRTASLQETPERTDAAAPEHAPTGTYHAPVGARFSFDLRHDSTVNFGDDSSVTVAVRGGLVETVLAREADEVIAALEYDVAVQSAGSDAAAAARIAEELAEPALVRLDANGLPLAVAFAEGTSQRARDLVKGLVSSFRAVGSEAERFEVRAPELNGTATLLVRWLERDGRGGVLRADRSGFEALAGAEAAGGAPAPTGSSTATIDGTRGWRTGLEFAETLDHRAGEVLHLTGESSGALELTGADFVSVADLLERIESRGGLVWRPLHTSSDEVDRDAAASLERRQWEVRLEGVAASDLVGHVERVLGTQPVNGDALRDTAEHLEWLLRLRPEALGEVAELLERVELGTQAILLGVAGKVGTADCQELVLAIASDRGRAPELREEGLMAMTHVTEPTTEAVDAMVRLVESGDDQDGLGLMVAGAMAARNPEAAGRVLALLEDRAPASGESESAVEWMNAVGNTHSPAAAPLALAHLDAASEELRAAAVVAAARTAGPAADADLARVASSDSSSRVRLQAGRVLALRPGAPVAQVEALLDVEKDPYVRRSILRCYSDRLDEPAVRALLGRVADDADEELATVAHGMLTE